MEGKILRDSYGWRDGDISDRSMACINGEKRCCFWVDYTLDDALDLRAILAFDTGTICWGGRMYCSGDDKSHKDSWLKFIELA